MIWSEEMGVVWSERMGVVFILLVCFDLSPVSALPLLVSANVVLVSPKFENIHFFLMFKIIF